eukprot:g51849.t1
MQLEEQVRRPVSQAVPHSPRDLQSFHGYRSPGKSVGSPDKQRFSAQGSPRFYISDAYSTSSSRSPHELTLSPLMIPQREADLHGAIPELSPHNARRGLMAAKSHPLRQEERQYRVQEPTTPNECGTRNEQKLTLSPNQGTLFLPLNANTIPELPDRSRSRELAFSPHRNRMPDLPDRPRCQELNFGHRGEEAHRMLQATPSSRQNSARRDQEEDLGGSGHSLLRGGQSPSLRGGQSPSASLRGGLALRRPDALHLGEQSTLHPITSESSPVFNSRDLQSQAPFSHSQRARDSRGSSPHTPRGHPQVRFATSHQQSDRPPSQLPSPGQHRQSPGGSYSHFAFESERSSSRQDYASFRELYDKSEDSKNGSLYHIVEYHSSPRGNLTPRRRQQQLQHMSPQHRSVRGGTSSPSAAQHSLPQQYHPHLSVKVGQHSLTSGGTGLSMGESLFPTDNSEPNSPELSPRLRVQVGSVNTDHYESAAAAHLTSPRGVPLGTPGSGRVRRHTNEALGSALSPRTVSSPHSSVFPLPALSVSRNFPENPLLTELKDRFVRVAPDKVGSWIKIAANNLQPREKKSKMVVGAGTVMLRCGVWLEYQRELLQDDNVVASLISRFYDFGLRMFETAVWKDSGKQCGSCRITFLNPQTGEALLEAFNKGWILKNTPLVTPIRERDLQQNRSLLWTIRFVNPSVYEEIHRQLSEGLASPRGGGDPPSPESDLRILVSPRNHDLGFGSPETDMERLSLIVSPRSRDASPERHSPPSLLDALQSPRGEPLVHHVSDTDMSNYVRMTPTNQRSRSETDMSSMLGSRFPNVSVHYHIVDVCDCRVDVVLVYFLVPFPFSPFSPFSLFSLILLFFYIVKCYQFNIHMERLKNQNDSMDNS